MSINQTNLEGRLTRDPETRNVGNSSVTKFTVACDRNFKKNDEWQKETAFVDCEVWGKQSDFVSSMCSKGTLVFVTGRLKQENWEKDGKKQSKLLVSADTVFIIQPRNNGEGQAPRASDGLNWGGDKPLPPTSDFDRANNSVGVSDEVPF